jgi:hypothetical protein
MAMARPGDLVVLTPTEVEDMWKHVLNYKPKPYPEALRPPEVLPAVEPGATAPRRRNGVRPHA